jgi:hypothetical protein
VLPESFKSEGAAAMVVKIIPNHNDYPHGKVAEAELQFTEGPLAGLRLIGFAVWERKSGNGRNVTFPARAYSVNGERRSFALLRPRSDAAAQDRSRTRCIVDNLGGVGSLTDPNNSFEKLAAFRGAAGNGGGNN